MKPCFHKIPFAFTEGSLNWISDNIFKLSELHNQNSPINSITCRLHNYNQSPPAVELRTSLEKLGLTGTNFEMFTYKPFVQPNLDGGYPHLDFLNEIPIPARINVLIEGKNDPMFWWPHSFESEYILKETKITDGKTSRMKGYLIDELSKLPRKELFKQLGNLADKTSELYAKDQAAIVRTDYLHAVTWTGGPRIILSMQIKNAWTQLEDLLSQDIS